MTNEWAYTDKIEMSRRIRAVQEWILQGQMTRDIISNILQKWDNITTERAAYNYLKKAYEGLKEHDDGKMAYKKARHIEARWKLYRDLKDKNTPRAASAAAGILDSIARIEGLFLPEKEQAADGEQTISVMQLADGTEIEI